MSSEASKRGPPSEAPGVARAFLADLRKLDRDLTLPVPERLRILRELEFDLEALRGELEARGMPAEEARAHALDALAPDGATVRELDRLHAPHYRRLTRHFSPGRLRTVERAALASITAAVLLVETFILLRADWLAHASPFLWPVFGLGALLFAAIAAQSFRLWVKRDHRGIDGSFRLVLFLSGLTLATGIFGAAADFLRLASVLESEPGLAGALLPEWLVESCVLLSFSLLLSMAGGLAWFIPARWLALVSGAHAELLGRPPARRADTGSNPFRAEGAAGRTADPAPAHHLASLGEPS